VSKELDGNVEPVDGSDEKLVAAARRGELAAFDALVGRYQKRASVVAYRLLNNVDDAMEVTQDAFLKAFEKIKTLAEPGRFGPWLLRIVGNMALNRRRARALRKTVSLESAGPDDESDLATSRPDPRALPPDAALDGADVERLTRQCLDEMPQTQRQALVLFAIEQMPQKDVAEVLGCSVEAVKWHVFAARKKLKERLKDYL